MIKLAWKNIISNPLGNILSICLVTMSVGLFIFFTHVNDQFQETMQRNTAGVHLILAAKGSPLQSVLCNLYHIDNPTGNITVDEVKAFFNPKHPLIDQAIPLSIGDSYKSYRIVGTTTQISGLYNAEVAAGGWWDRANEVVIGAQVAKTLKLKIGDQFQSSHGLVEDGMDHTHDSDLVVVGILAQSGSVLDHLILTSFKTIWALHGGHEADGDHAEHDHEAHGGHDHHHHEDHADHAGHVHSKVSGEQDEVSDLLTHPNEEITSVLLTFKNHNHQTLNMMRSINQNSTIQAAHPAWELNRLYSMVGIGTQLLAYLALLIGVVSMISIFLSLLQSLRSRKYELALLRALGARPGQVFRLITLEGLIQVLIGLLLGLLLAHVGLQLMDGMVEDRFRYQINAWEFGRTELYVMLTTVVLGLIAALWPAYQAYRVDVNKTLQEG